MHRSHLSVLVIFAAAAACSKRDNSEGTEILSRDSTLVAQLEIDRAARQVPLPTACGAVAVADRPAVASQTQAKELTLQARDAEMHGDIREARSQLRRALELDGTNKSAAYHLGRTSEALGDSTAAITAYCRYLALSPTTAESAEARQRVSKLSQTQTRVSAGSVTESDTTGRRASSARARRVRRVAAASRERNADPARATASGTQSASRPSDPVTSSSTEVDGTAGSTASGSDVVTAERPAPTADHPSTEPGTVRRGPTRTQGAIVGAATGAIIGAATGRSVKGAVIGAAAGGIFGTVVGPRIRSMGPGIRS